MASHRTQQIVARIPESPATEKLRTAAIAVLELGEKCWARVEDLKRSGKFTAEGVILTMSELLKGGVVQEMRRARLPIDKAVQDLKDRRARLKRPPVDKTDLVAAWDRMEIRNYLEALPQLKREALLQDTACNPSLIDAVLNAPARELVTLSDGVLERIESGRLEQLHGSALREIEQMQEAVDAATAAATIARADLVAATGLPPEQFERLVEPIERGVGLPWLKKENGRVIVVRPGRSNYQAATPDELASGVFYESPQDFLAANGCSTAEEYMASIGLTMGDVRLKPA